MGIGGPFRWCLENSYTETCDLASDTNRFEGFVNQAVQGLVVSAGKCPLAKWREHQFLDLGNGQPRLRTSDVTIYYEMAK